MLCWPHWQSKSTPETKVRDSRDPGRPNVNLQAGKDFNDGKIINGDGEWKVIYIPVAGRSSCF